jgi:hypothetical protein
MKDGLNMCEGIVYNKHDIIRTFKVHLNREPLQNSVGLPHHRFKKLKVGLRTRPAFILCETATKEYRNFFISTHVCFTQFPHCSIKKMYQAVISLQND